MNYWLDWLNETDEQIKEDKMYFISSHQDVYSQFIIQAQQWAKDKECTKKEYIYFITFTTRPETREGSEEFLKSQAVRESLKIVSFSYVKEHTETNLHYHVLLTSHKSLEKSVFKHWISSRGNIDFKRVKPETLNTVKSYMMKENQPIVLF